VLTTVPVADDRLRAELGRRVDAEGVQVRVVSPASDVSRLEWLANDEDAARERADLKAQETARASDVEVVDAGVGDADPVQAIEDALREWPADEVLVVTPPDEQTNWLESDAAEGARARLGVPVSHLTIT
jgi:hypothetical protein